MLLIEKAAVRTSTDATFELATIVPSNELPGPMVRVENHMRTIRGGAFGRSIGAFGSLAGKRSETVRLTGIEAGFDEQAPKDPTSAATSVNVITWSPNVRDVRSSGARMESESLPPREIKPAEFREYATAEPGRATALDWLVTLSAVWIVTGLFIDAHQHLFLAVESFINPWHMTMYSGAAFAALVLGTAIGRRYRPGRSFWDAVPFGYAQSVVGVAGLLVGGALDAVWHSIFGFEHQLDLLLSPPHLFLLTGLFFLITGPVRSGVARARPKNLLEQVPALVCLGLAFEIAQFVTQYGFYPEALMRDHPLSQITFHNEQFILSVFLFYRQALEIAIIIWQSLLLVTAVLYFAAVQRPHFGAIAIICLGEKLWIGGELSSGALEYSLIVLASLIAGLLGDIVVAKWNASLSRPNAFRALGFIVPSAYWAAYFALAVPMFGGTWWDASFVFGAIVEGGLVGLCVSQLFLAGSKQWRSVSES